MTRKSVKKGASRLVVWSSWNNVLDLRLVFGFPDGVSVIRFPMGKVNPIGGNCFAMSLKDEAYILGFAMYLQGHLRPFSKPRLRLWLAWPQAGIIVPFPLGGNK